MKFASILLPLFLAAALPPSSVVDENDYEVLLLPQTSHVFILNDNRVFLFHTNGDTTLLPSIENLQLRDWNGGSPIVATVFNARVGNQQSTTTYVDAKGRKHTLVTKCTSIETRANCAKRHFAYVEAYEELFPPPFGGK